MSKAFTKETDNDDDGQELDGASAAASIVPKGTKNYITPHGANRLREEFKKLLYGERPKLVETITWAASNGDRSENADYIYGKRRLREIDRRIRFLGKRLEAAEIIDPTQQRSDRVLFGASVTARDEDGKERQYSIVGVDEIDAKRGRVSWISPMGKSLLRSKVGETVTVHTPKGDEDLEIIALRYEAIED